MLHHFFTQLCAAKIPVTTREYLTLVEALDKGVIEPEIGHFHSVSRAAPVKDEQDVMLFEELAFMARKAPAVERIALASDALMKADVAALEAFASNQL